MFQYTYANFFALHAPPYRCERGVAFDEGGGTSLLDDPIPKFRFLAEVVSAETRVSRQPLFVSPRRERSIARRGGIFKDYRERGVTRGGIVILLFGRKLNSDPVHVVDVVLTDVRELISWIKRNCERGWRESK